MLNTSQFGWGLEPWMVGLILLPILIVHLKPARARQVLVVALVMVLCLPVAALAFDMFIDCDWDYILNQYCGGWQACAWAWWIGSQCY